MIILGIDPGLRTTGFGVIEKHGARLRYIASGTIKTGLEGALPPRLSRSSLPFRCIHAKKSKRSQTRC